MHITDTSASSPRALVVDDDFLSRRMISDSLYSRGFSVEDVDNAEDCLRLLSDGRPVDLLVSDLRMPSVNGEQLVKSVRALDSAHAPFILVVTGDVTSRLELQLQQAGADAVLSKRLGAPLIASAAEMLVASRTPPDTFTPAVTMLHERPPQLARGAVG
ncbi:MAG TPA: response regulator [Anaeromyxobacteraceae bacterium]|nr:response regulator [Anaeromyxobacteraceae bacterium]